jgi:hypothetical protein
MDAMTRYAITKKHDHTSAQRHRRYVARLRQQAVKLYPKECADCGRTDKPLDWSHIKPTGLSGRSRGTVAQLRDVLAHPASYRRRCRTCHVKFDQANGLTTPDELARKAWGS